MPPWNAVKGFGEFRDDRGLPQEDLEIIAEWVDGGEPEGNPTYMPSAPDFTDQGGSGPQADGDRRLRVLGHLALKHAVSAVGVEPQIAGGPNFLQAIAHYPNGEVEPLIWVEKFNPDYNKVYYFRDPLHFPAGTQIEVLPPQAAIDLLVTTKTSALKQAH